MKTLKTLLSIAALGLLATLAPMAHASGHQPEPTKPKSPSFQVGMYRKINTMTMNLLIEKKLGDQLLVMLIDERGKVLHKEALSRKQQKYSRPLNFEETRDGTYTLVIRNGEEQISKQIRLSTHTLYEMPKRLLIADN